MSKKLWTFVSTLSVCVSALSVDSMETNKIIDKDNDTKTPKSYIFGKSVINETNSLARIKKAIEPVNKKVLVVCDIDRTILKQTNIAFAYKYENEWNYVQHRFEEEYPSYKKNYDYYSEIMYKTNEEILIDAGWISFINDIKKQGGKVIAVTAIQNKKMYNEMLLDMRKEKLKQVGIDFSGSFEANPHWFGKSEKSQYYEAGILTSQPGTKSEALEAFFQYVNYLPYKIICIDDQKHNLIDLNEFCLKAEIKFIGYEYTKANDIPYPLHFSYELAFFQLKYLVENAVFPTDTQAQQLMMGTNAKIAQEQKEYLEQKESKENIASVANMNKQDDSLKNKNTKGKEEKNACKANVQDKKEKKENE